MCNLVEVRQSQESSVELFPSGTLGLQGRGTWKHLPKIMKIKGMASA